MHLSGKTTYLFSASEMNKILKVGFRAKPKLIEDDANGFMKALYYFSHF